MDVEISMNDRNSMSNESDFNNIVRLLLTLSETKLLNKIWFSNRFQQDF